MIGGTWHGWGTWEVGPEAGPRVLFDPCISSLLDEPHARLEDLRGDVIVVTHGHHEHLRDLCRVLRRLDLPVVAPPQVADYLVGRRHLPSRRVHAVEAEASIQFDGVELVARGFPHLEKHDVGGKLAILARASPSHLVRLAAWHGPRVLGAWWVIRNQPDGGPHLAWDLRWPRVGRAFVSVEALTHLLSAEHVRAWKEADPQPFDLLLAGVESGQEEHAARLAAGFDAAGVFAAPVHAAFERFYQRPPVDGARFLLGAPQSWQFWERPGRFVALDTPRRRA